MELLDICFEILEQRWPTGGPWALTPLIASATLSTASKFPRQHEPPTLSVCWLFYQANGESQLAGSVFEHALRSYLFLLWSHLTIDQIVKNSLK